MKIDFLFQSSPWFVPLCLLVGALYAVLLYRKDTHFTKTLRWVLAALRFLAGSIICFLMLNLLLRQITQTFQKKTVVLAIDNSASMNVAGNKALAELKTQLKSLQENLLDKDYEVEIQTLNEEQPNQAIDSLRFGYKTSNLSSLLNGLKTNYEGKNLVDVVLVSDGISNQGVSPASLKLSMPVHTVGLGDTIPKKDIAIRSVFANKIAYLGNKFPIQADVSAYGFGGRTANVILKQGDQIIDKKTITFKNNDALETIDFQATATQKGVQRYVIVVESLGGEFSNRNNTQDVFVEVIDGKQKILLLALAPHPDLKAIRSIIEKNENYEVEIVALTQNQSPDFSGKNFDLIILHQLPDVFNNGPAFIKRFIDQGTPLMFILGNQGNTAYLNQLNSTIQVLSGQGQVDKVSGYFNETFGLVNLDPEKLKIIEKLPQISVPFGEYRLQPNSEVILYQKVGSLKTQKPLFVINTGAKKSATFLGEGLWQWRLEEFALTEKQEVVDELFLKVIQYIAGKEDKRKLRVYPTATEYNLGDKVVFQSEMYNAIYERLYNIPIKLDIIDDKKATRSYTYTPTADNSAFEISNLPQGVYKFKATATILGQNEEAQGEFFVRDIAIEQQNLTADFGLLRSVSAASGGRFFKVNQFDSLLQTLLNHQAPERVDSTEDLREVINLRWLFFVLLALLTAEWVLRKYWGSY
jgi:hypothetical protein